MNRSVKEVIENGRRELDAFLIEQGVNKRQFMHFEICDVCAGRGLRDHPAFQNGFSADDEFVDMDFIADYLAGAYDVTCDHCGGSGKVEVMDASLFDMWLQQKLLPEEYDYYVSELASLGRYEEEEAAMDVLRRRGVQF